MKRILYSSGSVLTGDRVARAVVQYATALVNNRSADAVTIPVAGEGASGAVEMLIGPASQLLVEDAGPDPADLDHTTAVAEIQRRIDRIERPAPIEAVLRGSNLEAFEIL